MVSFSCEIHVCNDTIIKKKLAQHSQRCYGAYYTCIDCNITFSNNEHQFHTSCISEAEKYEKALYKGKKKGNNQTPQAIKKDERPLEPTDTKKESSVETKQGTDEDKKNKKPKKESKDKKKEDKKDDSNDISSLISDKPTSLYKIIKQLSKSQKKSSKMILKNLKIQSQNGAISFS